MGIDYDQVYVRVCVCVYCTWSCTSPCNCAVVKPAISLPVPADMVVPLCSQVSWTHRQMCVCVCVCHADPSQEA